MPLDSPPFATFTLPTDDEGDGASARRYENRLALYRYEEFIGLTLDYREVGDDGAWGTTEEIGIPNEHAEGIAAAMLKDGTLFSVVDVLRRERLADEGDALAVLRRILRERDALREELGKQAERGTLADAAARTELVMAIEDLVDAKSVLEDARRRLPNPAIEAFVRVVQSKRPVDLNDEAACKAYREEVLKVHEPVLHASSAQSERARGIPPTKMVALLCEHADVMAAAIVRGAYHQLGHEFDGRTTGFTCLIVPPHNAIGLLRCFADATAISALDAEPVTPRALRVVVIAATGVLVAQLEFPAPFVGMSIGGRC